MSDKKTGTQQFRKPPRQLISSLRRRIAARSWEFVEAAGGVHPRPPSKEQIEELERLLRLSALHERATRSRSAVVGTLILAIVLPCYGLFPVKDVDLELSVTTTTAHFHSTTPRDLGSRESVKVFSLGLEGMKWRDCPVCAGRVEMDRYLLIASSDREAPGKIEVQQFRCTRPASFTVESEDLKTISVLVEPDPGGTVMVAAQLDGTVDSFSEVKARRSFDADLAEFYSDGKATIRLAPLATTSQLAHQLPVDVLGFETEEGGKLPYSVSTIEEGWFTFPEIGETPKKLNRGDLLRLGGVEGILRSIDAGHGRVKVSFHGKVSGMRVGSGSPRQLLPSRIEMLKAQEPLKLYSVVVAYLFSVTLSLWRFGRRGLISNDFLKGEADD